MEKIHLLGRDHTVLLPGFAEREELVVARHEASTRSTSAQLRVQSAALGLCTRLGRESGVDYAGCKCDVLVYGGKVYAWLREQGLAPKDIAKAAVGVLDLVTASLAPREPEVKAAEDFTEAGGAGST